MLKKDCPFSRSPTRLAFLFVLWSFDKMFIKIFVLYQKDKKKDKIQKKIVCSPGAQLGSRLKSVIFEQNCFGRNFLINAEIFYGSPKIKMKIENKTKKFFNNEEK